MCFSPWIIEKLKGLFCFETKYIEEESQVSDRRMQISYGGLAVIVLLWIYEGYRYVNTGYFSPLGWGFNYFISADVDMACCF